MEDQDVDHNKILKVRIDYGQLEQPSNIDFSSHDNIHQHINTDPAQNQSTITEELKLTPYNIDQPGRSVFSNDYSFICYFEQYENSNYSSEHENYESLWNRNADKNNDVIQQVEYKNLMDFTTNRQIPLQIISIGTINKQQQSYNSYSDFPIFQSDNNRMAIDRTNKYLVLYSDRDQNEEATLLLILEITQNKDEQYQLRHMNSFLCKPQFSKIQFIHNNQMLIHGKNNYKLFRFQTHSERVFEIISESKEYNAVFNNYHCDLQHFYSIELATQERDRDYTFKYLAFNPNYQERKNEENKERVISNLEVQLTFGNNQQQANNQQEMEQKSLFNRILHQNKDNKVKETHDQRQTQQIPNEMPSLKQKLNIDKNIKNVRFQDSYVIVELENKYNTILIYKIIKNPTVDIKLFKELNLYTFNVIIKNDIFYTHLENDQLIYFNKSNMPVVCILKDPFNDDESDCHQSCFKTDKSQKNDKPQQKTKQIEPQLFQQNSLVKILHLGNIEEDKQNKKKGFKFVVLLEQQNNDGDVQYIVHYKKYEEFRLREVQKYTTEFLHGSLYDQKKIEIQNGDNLSNTIEKILSIREFIYQYVDKSLKFPINDSLYTELELQEVEQQLEKKQNQHYILINDTQDKAFLLMNDDNYQQKQPKYSIYQFGKQPFDFNLPHEEENGRALLGRFDSLKNAFILFFLTGLRTSIYEINIDQQTVLFKDSIQYLNSIEELYRMQEFFIGKTQRNEMHSEILPLKLVYVENQDSVVALTGAGEVFIYDILNGQLTQQILCDEKLKKRTFRRKSVKKQTTTVKNIQSQYNSLSQTATTKINNNNIDQTENQSAQNEWQNNEGVQFDLSVFFKWPLYFQNATNHIIIGQKHNQLQIYEIKKKGFELVLSNDLSSDFKPSKSKDYQIYEIHQDGSLVYLNYSNLLVIVDIAHIEIKGKIQLGQLHNQDWFFDKVRGIFYIKSMRQIECYNQYMMNDVVQLSKHKLKIEINIDGSPHINILNLNQQSLCRINYQFQFPNILKIYYLMKFRDLKILDKKLLEMFFELTFSDLVQFLPYKGYYSFMHYLIIVLADNPRNHKILTKILRKIYKKHNKLVLIQDFEGKTPLDYAIEKKNSDIINILLEWIIEFSNNPLINYAMDKHLIKLIKKNYYLNDYLDSQLCIFQIKNKIYHNNSSDQSALIVGLNKTDLYDIVNDYSLIGDYLNENRQSYKVDIEYFVINLQTTLTGKIDNDNKKSNHICPKDIIEAISNRTDLKFYQTLVIQTIIDFKWQTYTKNFFIKQLLVYMLFLLCYVLEIYFFVVMDEDLVRSPAQTITLRIVCFSIIMLQILYESKQIKSGGFREYFNDHWNVLDFMIIVFYPTIVIVDFTGKSRHYVAIAMCLFLFMLFFKLCFFLRIFDSFSFLVSMIFEVFKGLKQFLVFYTFVIILFGLSFTLIISRENEDVMLYDGVNYFAYFIMAFRASTGDFQVDHFYTLDSQMIIFAWIVWILSVIFLNIILLNFIIAVISQSYETTMQYLKVKIMMMKAEMIKEREALFSHKELKNEKYFPSYIMLRRPVMYRREQKDEQQYEVVHEIRKQIVDMRKKFEKTINLSNETQSKMNKEMKELRQDIQLIAKSIQTQQRMIKEMHDANEVVTPRKNDLQKKISQKIIEETIRTIPGQYLKQKLNLFEEQDSFHSDSSEDEEFKD